MIKEKEQDIEVNDTMTK